MLSNARYTDTTFDCRVTLCVVQHVALRDDTITGLLKNNDSTYSTSITKCLLYTRSVPGTLRVKEINKIEAVPSRNSWSV